MTEAQFKTNLLLIAMMGLALFVVGVALYALAEKVAPLQCRLSRLFPPCPFSLSVFRLNCSSRYPTLLATLLVTLVAAVDVQGSEYLDSDRPVPADAQAVVYPVDGALADPEKTDRPVILRDLKRVLETSPPVLRDSTLTFNFRTYDFRRKNRDGSRSEATATGGEIALDTGKIAGIAEIGLSYYFSLGLRAPNDKPGSGLLSDDQDDLHTLGRAFLKIGDSETLEARLFRQVFYLPYINRDVGRMIPRTHEAYVLKHESAKFDIAAGHFTRTKAQSHDSFQHMSEEAGAPGTSKGVSAAVGKLRLGDDATVGVFNYYGWDTYNTLYTEADWSSVLFGDYGIKVGAQYTNQQSVGDELVGNFDTNQFGIQLAGSHHGAVLLLAYTYTDKDGAIRRDWGEPPGYNFAFMETFLRAGEHAIGAEISLTGEPWGAPWFSSSFNVTRGFDARDETSGASLSDVTEYDLWLNVAPTGEFWQGLKLRVLLSASDFDEGRDRWQTRVILDYPFRFL